MDRRKFLSDSTRTAGLGLALAAAADSATSAAEEAAAKRVAANDQVAVAVAGVRGRGNRLLTTFASLNNVEVKYVCDIDEGVLNSRTDQVTKLLRPLDGGTSGGYGLVDQVRYDDQPPWPNVASSGASLTRTALDAFGDLAANWTAAGICAHESAMNGGKRIEIPQAE